jgi:5'-phosphate synthase pdxT subunit
MTVGVLALQGGFASHIAVLEKIGAKTLEVRDTRNLESCDAFIVPGGESTVLSKLLMSPSWEPGMVPVPGELWIAIRAFASAKPVMGTCAGLIMLAETCTDPRVVPFGILPVTIARNAYGRQTDSFIEKIAIPVLSGEPYTATFIRAPRIQAVGPGVEVLAEASGHGTSEPVMVQKGNLLGLSFHPELTPEDTRIHEYFISLMD